MWYKTYASCMYAKISISIYVGSITLNIYSHMTYVSIQSLGKGTQFWISWLTLTSFLFILFWSILLGDPRLSPNAFVSFFLFFYSFLFACLRTKGLWNRCPTTSFLLILFFLDFSELTLRVWDRIPTTSLYFSLIPLSSLEVVGSIPTCLNIYFHLIT